MTDRELPAGTPSHARARSLRVANGAGFWGDSIDAPVRLVESADFDVLTLEYLAELTLAILAHVRSKDARAGFVTDLPPLLARLAPALRDRPGLTIVTNGGGLNPEACAAACASVVDPALPIAVVEGDDLLDHLPGWIADGATFPHLETGQPIAAIANRLVCANAYLGARPIAEALRRGARLVLTGRVADASLTLGPAVAHFGWAWDDWDRLAGASVAGHLIECGAQATGGLWHDWEHVPDLAGIGYPIAELAADGSCTLTRPDGSGGLVTVGNVAEQLVYEIGDPAAYRTPDLDVDLTTVALAQSGPDRVAVTGAIGRPPTDQYKVSAVYRDGWAATGLLAVTGRQAEAKARAAGAIVLERVRRAGFELDRSLVEVLGAGDVVRGTVRPAAPPFEVVLRISVRDPRREAVARFCRELAPLITAGPPGLAGYATGRPEPRPAFGYWPTLIPKSLINPGVTVRPAGAWSVERRSSSSGEASR